MVPLLKLYYVTFTYFLEVNCFFIRSLKGYELAQNGWETFVIFFICHGMVSLRNLDCDLGLLFESKFLSLKRYELAQKRVEDTFRFSHLPSNGVIAKIILCDLGLLSEGQTF